jgi:hypothetical protein
MVWKGSAPLRRAVSMVVRTSASAYTAHMARYPLVTFRWITLGLKSRSQVLLVAATSPGAVQILVKGISPLTIILFLILGFGLVRTVSRQ